jgi:hypothetical protein
LASKLAICEDLSSRRWIGLVFISLAVALIIVDSTIVNVAVPAIVEDLGISSTQVQWVQEAYTLVFASMLLLFGSLADRFGRRRILLTGVVLFAGASVAAGLAGSGDLLIAARLVQGVGGAMMLPSTLSLLNATFRGRERGIAFAVWGSTIGGMAAVGPLLGGWLTTDFSWRWAFGINVPLGILIFVGVLLTVAESREDTAGRVDVVGAVLSVLLFGTLVFGLIEGRARVVGGGRRLHHRHLDVAVEHLARPDRIRGDDRRPRPLRPLGPASLARGQSDPSRPETVLDLDVPQRQPRGARRGARRVRHHPVAADLAAVRAGLRRAADGPRTDRPCGGILRRERIRRGIQRQGQPRADRASGPRGRDRRHRVGGTRRRSDAAWGWLLPALFVYGFGVGLATAQLTGVILQDVPVQLSGQGSGTQSTARQVGSALGIAILGTVLFSSTAGILSSSLDDRGVPASERDQIVSAVVDSAGAAIAGLEQNPQTADAAADAKAAFSDGTRLSAFTAAGFLAIGLLATIPLGAHRGVSGSKRRCEKWQVFKSEVAGLAPVATRRP